MTKVVGKPFKKGKSGNPGGKPKVPDDIREARKLNQVELERTVNRYLFMDRAQVQETIKNPETPMLELMVASIMAKASQNGDHQRLEFIFSRLLGKVKDDSGNTVTSLVSILDALKSGGTTLDHIVAHLSTIKTP